VHVFIYLFIYLVWFIVKYSDDVVLPAKEEMVLQGMTNKLVEIGSCCGIEMTVGETTVMTISRQIFSL
jgi:hypothetical protein